MYIIYLTSKTVENNIKEKCVSSLSFSVDVITSNKVEASKFQLYIRKLQKISKKFEKFHKNFKNSRIYLNFKIFKKNSKYNL